MRSNDVPTVGVPVLQDDRACPVLKLQVRVRWTDGGRGDGGAGRHEHKRKRNHTGRRGGGTSPVDPEEQEASTVRDQ